MNGAFLQTKEWEGIHRAMNRKTWRLKNILVVRHDLPRGFNYLYCPRPVFRDTPLREFLAAVEGVARQEKSLFLKIDPVEALAVSGLDARFRTSDPLQPRQTTVIDLSQSDEELLRAMHEKTRYNIGLAERKEVEVVPILHNNVKDDFATFWSLLSTTAEREEFFLHDRGYYELLAGLRTRDVANELFFAKIKDTVVAAALINFHRDPVSGINGATYLHGASLRDNKEAMAPHLLHWRIMQEAKQRQFQFYDLWGINEKRWPGLTRFKLGFGGQVIECPASCDIVYRPFWYALYRWRKIRAQGLKYE